MKKQPTLQTATKEELELALQNLKEIEGEKRDEEIDVLLKPLLQEAKTISRPESFFLDKKEYRGIIEFGFDYEDDEFFCDIIRYKGEDKLLKCMINENYYDGDDNLFYVKLVPEAFEYYKSLKTNYNNFKNKVRKVAKENKVKFSDLWDNI